jgi:hypothetical protein
MGFHSDAAVRESEAKRIADVHAAMAGRLRA